MSEILLYIFAVLGMLYVIKILIFLGVHISIYISEQFSDYNCKYIGRETTSYFGTTEFGDWHLIPTFSICFQGINSGITFYWLKYTINIYTHFYTEQEEEAISRFRQEISKEIKKTNES